MEFLAGVGLGLFLGMSISIIVYHVGEFIAWRKEVDKKLEIIEGDGEV